MSTLRNKTYLKWIVPVLIAAVIKWFSRYPAAVEQYYSNGIYPVISRILRFLFGWVPFSVGDILYLVIGVWLLVTVYRAIRAIWQRRVDGQWLFRSGMRVILVWLWIYIIFNLFWGLNYNRLGIAHQAGVQVAPYTTEELDSLVSKLVFRLDSLQPLSLAERDPLKHKRTLFKNAFNAYKEPRSNAMFLKYGGRSVKPSLYSYLGNYLGFTGYYNPLTGEAQVNTTVPVFQQPNTTCHEIGHQLGYAKENEANMAGYLTASQSHSAAFRYSAFFDLFEYAIRDLYQRDSVRARVHWNNLSAPVKGDIEELNAFIQRHQGYLEPLIRKMYAQFLRANNQPKGMMSYNQVVGLVIAFEKAKLGKTKAAETTARP
ncbi:MAG: DUF3810 domain-containing protein [Bacteroidetes bacterium]|nr:DUF3810 domain-containing protein [Bacteroidota bacterium]